jgi:hypothetical protein
VVGRLYWDSCVGIHICVATLNPNPHVSTQMYIGTCTSHARVSKLHVHMYNTLLDTLKLYHDATGSAVSLPSHACTSYLPHCSQNQARYEWSRATRDYNSFFDNILCGIDTSTQNPHFWHPTTLSHLDRQSHAAVLLTRCVPAFFLSALGIYPAMFVPLGSPDSRGLVGLAKIRWSPGEEGPRT